MNRQKRQLSADISRATVDATIGARSSRVDAANALRILRPSLGDTAGVALYRLLRLVALEDIIGRGAGATAYVAGKKLGVSLGLTQLDDFLELCDALAIGIIKVPVMTDSRIYIDVYECVTCAGMETVGRTLCQFEAGIVGGAVQSIAGKPTKAKEITCIGGLGHDSCGIEVLL